MQQLKQPFLPRLLHSAAVSVAVERHREKSDRRTNRCAAPYVLTTRAQRENSSVFLAACGCAATSGVATARNPEGRTGLASEPASEMSLQRQANLVPQELPHAAVIKPGKYSRPAALEREGCSLV